MLAGWMLQPAADASRALGSTSFSRRGRTGTTRVRCSTRRCEAATPFRAACKEHGALFILNDRPDLAEACNADGVHVGRGDTPVADAKALVWPNRLVGLSASTIEELEDAGEADYVGVTAFATPTKEDAVAGGLDLVRAAAEVLTVPWFAIGGIDLSNVEEVAAAGAPGVAVVRAIRDADDPESAARTLRATL